MDRKTYCLVAGIILSLVALFHLLRIFEDWPIIIGDWSVPKWVSWVALIVAGALLFLGLGSQRKKTSRATYLPHTA
jgi:hypothetical protein